MNTILGLVRKSLATVVVLSAMGTVSVGTFASFTAQASNPGSAVQTGTIVLNNTKQGGSACLSTTGGNTDTNANGACDTLLSLLAQRPGDSATASLTLRNNGSIAASTLGTFVTAGCVNADAPAETYHGSGSPCGKIQIYLQEYSDAAFSAAANCRYGGSSDGGTTCDFSDTAKTLAAFATAHPSSASQLALAGGLAAGSSRYVKVGVKLPSDADNTYQGRKATIGIDWAIAQ